jgi:hypothetical protein
MLLNLWGAVGRDVMIRLLLFFLYKKAWTRRPSMAQCISETDGVSQLGSTEREGKEGSKSL